MPPKLPGFYYDEEKGRYFRETLGTGSRIDGRELKKRKVEQQKVVAAKNLTTRRKEIYKQYIFELFDPLEQEFGISNASRYIEGLKIEDRLHADSKCHNTRIDRSFGVVPLHHEIGKHILCESSSKDNFRLAFTSRNCQVESYIHNSSEGNDSGIMELEKYLPENLEVRLGSPSENSGYKTVRLEGSSFATRGLYCHLAEKDSGRHLFVTVKRGQILNRLIRTEQFAAHQNVHDSIDVGEMFLVAVGPSLELFSWEERGSQYHKKLQLSKKRSDILCLASGTSDQISINLYAGCRDGSIYVIKMHLVGRQEIVSKKCFKLPGVRSILSMKTTDLEGILFISAISNDSQVLMMLDLMLDPADCILVTFNTSFFNMTEEHEVFEVTSNGRFLIYGSTASHDGRGDYELFSSNQADNLVHEKSGNGITFFPLKTLRKDYLMSSDLQELGLRAVGFGKLAPNCLNVSGNEETYKVFMILQSVSNPTAMFLPNMALMSTDVV